MTQKPAFTWAGKVIPGALRPGAAVPEHPPLPDDPRAARQIITDLARRATVEALAALRSIVNDPDVTEQLRLQASVALLNRGHADCPKASVVAVEAKVPEEMDRLELMAAIRELLPPRPPAPGPQIIEVEPVSEAQSPSASPGRGGNTPLKQP
jgi:hypothetical protein